MGEDGDRVAPDHDRVVAEAGVQVGRPRLDQVRKSRRHVRQDDNGVRPHHLMSGEGDIAHLADFIVRMR